MAQVSEGLIAEWRESIKNGFRPAITDNEFEQLMFAWEALQARASLQGGDSHVCAPLRLMRFLGSAGYANAGLPKPVMRGRRGDGNR